METPQKALDALIDPDPLTLGQIALLERIKSPLLDGRSTAIADVAPSLWLLSLPIEEAVKRWKEADVQGILYVNRMTPKEYTDHLISAFNASGKFLEMLPRAEEKDKKKDMATDTSLS